MGMILKLLFQYLNTFCTGERGPFNTCIEVVSPRTEGKLSNWQDSQEFLKRLPCLQSKNGMVDDTSISKKMLGSGKYYKGGRPSPVKDDNSCCLKVSKAKSYGCTQTQVGSPEIRHSSQQYHILLWKRLFAGTVPENNMIYARTLLGGNIL